MTTKTKTKPADVRKGAKHDTREAWLNAATAAVRPLFDEQGAADYPKNLRVSVGFPKGGRGKAIGQCWADTVSKDGATEIFISPELDDPLRVLDVLIHELVHAIVGIDAGHKGPFRKLAKSVGLEGKMTATTATEELKDKLAHMMGELGRFPHAQLRPGLRTTKQGTRMLKVTCPDCGYSLRTTAKWIEVGLPTCCCGAEMEGPES